MTEIIPAIIGKTFAEVTQKISQVEGLANWVQLDVMDGSFTQEYSWNKPDDLANLEGKIKLEAHLMLREPEEVVEDWAKVCDRIIVHLEATENLAETLELINKHACESAICLLLNTSIAKLAPFVAQTKNIQLMGIATIGHHGEKLDKSVLEKIKSLRASYPDVKISVDGGVTRENAGELIAAGADRLVAGSVIWNSENIADAINTLQNALRRQDQSSGE